MKQSDLLFLYENHFDKDLQDFLLQALVAYLIILVHIIYQFDIYQIQPGNLL